MKHVLITLTLAAAFTLKSFAGNNTVNYMAEQHFTAAFKGATNVEWKVNADYVKAIFIYDGQKQEAFYDLNGKAIGTTKAVTVERLPENGLQTINKKYRNYKLVEAIEFNNDDETAYFVTVDSDTKTLILKISETGAVTTVKNIIK